MTDNPSQPHGVVPEMIGSAVKVDLSKAPAVYVNFCRVTGTPEEIIIDFALGSELATGGANRSLSASRRVSLHHFTAKRLHQALGMAIGRFESMFGVVEPDVVSRVISQLPKSS